MPVSSFCAIAHKDYASGIPIQISVYDDKLMMWNPGQLPPDWSLERLLAKHSSQPANPDIANAFFRAGKIESWGRGIDLIRNKCIDDGYPAPSFSCDSSGLWIEFTFPENAPVNTGEVTGQVTASQPESQPESIEMRVLRLLTQGPLSKSAISIALGQKEISGHLNQVIRVLLNDQTLEYTLPDKPNSRLQQYRLTEKGKLLLGALRKWNLP